jgi:hypothetical protein
VFGVSIAFHTSKLFWIMTTTMLVYGTDFMYCKFGRTYRIESCKFLRLGNGTQITFANPKGWSDRKIGYINVCIPWISKTQWHPFSVYINRDGSSTSNVCIMNSGDWTGALHAAVEHGESRPVWVQGPFVSPYSASLDFSSLVRVTTRVFVLQTKIFQCKFVV